MIAAVIVAGVTAEVLARRAVATRRISAWLAYGSVFGTLAVLAAATGRVAMSPSVRPAIAAAAGMASALVLFAATRAFLVAAGRSRAFAESVRRTYSMRRDLPVALTLVMASAIAVCEEFFWRGLVRSSFAGSMGRLSGSAGAWGLYVAANSSGANLSVLAGAIVGGALWTALAIWTRGVLASAICHASWTCLMIVFPPKSAA